MVDKKGSSSSWKMLQIGLVVRNMETAVERLSALGFGPFVPKLLPPDSQVRDGSGLPSESKVDVQRSTIGNVELELCQPVSGESPHQEYLDSKGEGIQHVLFAVQDLGEELARLTGAGATILRRVSFKGGGLAYVDLNTCGFIIELIQLPEDDPETLKIVLSL